MHRHPTQRRRQDARNAIAYWLDYETPAERETSEDIRSSIEIDDDESPSLVPEISAWTAPEIRSASSAVVRRREYE
jgi:hypothetical protein